MISGTCVPSSDGDTTPPPPPPPPADVTLSVVRQRHGGVVPVIVSKKPKRHVRFQNTCSPGSRCRSPPEEDLEVVEYVTDEL